MVLFVLCLDKLPVNFRHLKQEELMHLDSGLDDGYWLPESKQR